jgi:hypothetical protein
VFLGKDVPLQAGIMLEAVIKAITPKIMTWGQYAEAAYFMYQKKVMKNPAYKRYMPDYTKCMEHFALHAGAFLFLGANHSASSADSANHSRGLQHPLACGVLAPALWSLSQGLTGSTASLAMVG